MSTPFIGEIRIFSFNFAPKSWALCNGQLLPINQNQALFSLLGTQYGGNGQTNFGLPNMQGRTPIHRGNGITQGQLGGAENHTLTLAETPAHSHGLSVSSAAANNVVPTGNALANSGANIYAAPGATVALAAGSVASQGGSQPHTNMQPFLTLNFCIALSGIFPSRN